MSATRFLQKHKLTPTGEGATVPTEKEILELAELVGLVDAVVVELLVVAWRPRASTPVRPNVFGQRRAGLREPPPNPTSSGAGTAIRAREETVAANTAPTMISESKNFVEGSTACATAFSMFEAHLGSLQRACGGEPTRDLPRHGVGYGDLTRDGVGDLDAVGSLIGEAVGKGITKKGDDVKVDLVNGVLEIVFSMSAHMMPNNGCLVVESVPDDVPNSGVRRGAGVAPSLRVDKQMRLVVGAEVDDAVEIDDKT